MKRFAVLSCAAVLAFGLVPGQPASSRTLIATRIVNFSHGLSLSNQRMTGDLKSAKTRCFSNREINVLVNGVLDSQSSSDVDGHFFISRPQQQGASWKIVVKRGGIDHRRCGGASKSFVGD